MDDMVMSDQAPKRRGRPPAMREATKVVVWAYYAEHGILPSRNQLLELHPVATATADQALGEVRAVLEAAKAKPEAVKYTKANENLIEARIKVRAKKMEAEFEERVRAAVLEKNKEYLGRLERMEKEARDQLASYTQLINNHKPLLTEDQFKVIWVCLHPDNSASKDKREKAFNTFTDIRFQLTGKK